MNLQGYPVIVDSVHETYKFLSEGPNGTIMKIVRYQLISKGLYNLGFGDLDEKQGIDDQSRSNNNDRDKILITVAFTVIDFIKHHPNATVIVKGSTKARTRLYQMGISKNWIEIDRLFNIEGYYNGKWTFFRKGMNYEAFLLTQKINLNL